MPDDHGGATWQNSEFRGTVDVGRQRRRTLRNAGGRQRRVVVDVAVVGDRPADAQAAGELPALAEPPVQGEIDAVVHLRLSVAVIRRLGHQVVDPAEERRLDVVQAADLLPPPPGSRRSVGAVMQ